VRGFSLARQSPLASFSRRLAGDILEARRPHAVIDHYSNPGGCGSGISRERGISRRAVQLRRRRRRRRRRRSERAAISLFSSADLTQARRSRRSNPRGSGTIIPDGSHREPLTDIAPRPPAPFPFPRIALNDDSARQLIRLARKIDPRRDSEAVRSPDRGVNR